MGNSQKAKRTPTHTPAMPPDVCPEDSTFFCADTWSAILLLLSSQYLDNGLIKSHTVSPLKALPGYHSLGYLSLLSLL